MRKLLAPVAAAALLLAMVTTVFAWRATLTSDCAPDANSFAWKINLQNEPDYKIEFSFASNFSGSWTVDFGTSGEHSFTTPRTGATLYFRWVSDHNSKGSAAANANLCEQQSVAESVAQSAAESVAASVAQSVAESVAQSVAASASECQQTEQGGNTCPSAVQTVEAGTGTPAGSIPNTSIDGSGPNPLPTILFSLVLLGSLGGLAYTNVKVVARDKR